MLHRRLYRFAIVSPLVEAEILATPEPNVLQSLEGVLARWRPEVLSLSEEAFELAEKYLLQGTLSERQRMDARHLAVAVVARVDAVVSWNLRHMVKLKTRREVNAVNLLNGYPVIEIVTPSDVQRFPRRAAGK